MRKSILFSLLLAFASPLISSTRAGVDVQVNGGNPVYYQGYYYDDSYDGYYYGPGWYWGVWIDNENDYWHYHGNRSWHGHHDGRGHGHH
jgi:hypothetical protein